ncbi:MAG: hypothetical protein V1897_03365 [Pseudomonadota bacterium]
MTKNKLTLVCLDSNIVIWGIKGTASSGQEGMVPKAKAFLEYLQENKITALIPMPVLAEILIHVPAENHLGFIDHLRKGYHLPPFDFQAASFYARLFKTNIKSLKKERGDQHLTNRDIKADLMIVASALAQGASCIYSDDKGLMKVAGNAIKVEKLPSLARQERLPEL